MSEMNSTRVQQGAPGWRSGLWVLPFDIRWDHALRAMGSSIPQSGSLSQESASLHLLSLCPYPSLPLVLVHTLLLCLSQINT